MALKEVWFGSQGPFLYDDSDDWPDGEHMVGARTQQAFIEDAPTELEHAVRLSELGAYASESKVDSKVLSEGTLRSNADSALDSMVDSTGVISTSEATTRSTNDSVLLSQVDSLATRCSVLESKNLSGVFE